MTTSQLREGGIQRGVRNKLHAKLKEMQYNKGRYTSKAYKEYMIRVHHRHVRVDDFIKAKDPMAALGAAMAEVLRDTMSRPSCLRVLLQPGHPDVVEWRADLAEIDRRVAAVTATVLPYSRKIFYPNKELNEHPPE